LRLASCGAQGIPGLGANPQSDSDWHAWLMDQSHDLVSRVLH